MTFKISEQLGQTDGPSVQPVTSTAAPAGQQGDGSTAAQSDKIVLSDFTRLALLSPPHDQAELTQLQEKVFTGQYGPPAAIIAEALISRAIMSGLVPAASSP